ncbi:unnamed protein product, partial [Ilex paraguariensis]
VLTSEIAPVQVTPELSISSSTASPVIPFLADFVTRALAQSSPRVGIKVPIFGLPVISSTGLPGTLSVVLLEESAAELTSSFPPAPTRT